MTNSISEKLFTEVEKAVDSKEFFLAEQILNKIIQQGDEYQCDAYGTLSTFAFTAGNYEIALDLIETALKLNDRMDFRYGKASILKKLDRKEELFKYLKTFKDSSPDYYHLIGESALENKKVKDSITFLKKALSLVYTNNNLKIQILFKLSTAYKELGELVEASKCYLDIIALDKFNVSAYVNLVGIKKYNNFDVKNLELLLDSCITNSSTKSIIHNTLGAVYEQSDTQKSFNHYKKGNLIKREEFPKDLLSTYEQKVKNTISVFDNNYFKELKSQIDQNDSGEGLIFILGMPRSGSTLLEQVLVSNDEISTVGESSIIIDELNNIRSKIELDPTGLNFPKKLNYLGKETMKKYNFSTKFCVDKMPGNFNYIGLMYAIFPKAKFIYTTRNPLSVCFSGWTTMYAKGHGYSYTIKEMAEQYKLHEQIMNHWKSVLPTNTIFEVNYEEMIKNHHFCVQKLCNFINTQYTNKMKSFYKQKREIKTASVGQVDKPIYKTSLNRYSKFEDFTEEIKKFL